jgi:hypothetical protein
MPLRFSLANVVLRLALDHPLYPVCQGFEDTEQDFLVEFGENFSDPGDEVLSGLTTVIR